MASSSNPSAPPGPAIEAERGIWGRQLDRYPGNGRRAGYLAIVVLVTITLYYELYVQGSVAPVLAANMHMTLVFLLSISITGNALGALASVLAGLADRWGRANLVVYGLAVTGALVLFGLADAGNKWVYMVMFVSVGFVEGIMLVATPALIRDFSPQLGRASAMCFWTMGPVLGSFVVGEVASHTLETRTDWQYQFRVCGVVGLAVFVVAFVGLRELAPRLRDQIMVSLNDKTLIEANARDVVGRDDAGEDDEADEGGSGHWRQMLRMDIVGSAVAISLSLLFYYVAVGLFVVFFATNFGYSGARANALANWYWGANAVTLLLTGILSDALRVRKPFMLLGGLSGAVGVALFAIATTHPGTTYYEFVGILMPISIGGGLVFASWMAAFTETVEKHNPAATATGLAVWGATLRSIVVIALLTLMVVIPAASTLVGEAPQVAAVAAGQAPGLSASENATVKAVAADPGIVARVRTIASDDAAQLATAQKLSPQTKAALATTPDDPATQAQAVSEVSGLPVGEVTQVLTLDARYKAQLAAAQASSQAPVGIPQADLALLATDAKPVQDASTELSALSRLPAADLALVARYGPALHDPKVAAELKFLQTEAPAVRQARKDSPVQWQHWLWIAFAGQVLFIPFIWLLTGRWSPKKARRDAREHAEDVERRLAALGALGTLGTVGEPIS